MLRSEVWGCLLLALAAVGCSAKTTASTTAVDCPTASAGGEAPVAVELQQDTMAASGHMKADLFEMPLHGVGVGDWQY